MATIAVTVKAGEVGALRQRVERAVAKGLDRVGLLVVERTQGNLASGAGSYPQDRTGELSASVSHRVEGPKVIISASAPHAKYLELGQHPFLRPTLAECEAEIPRILEAALREELAQ